MEYRNHLPIPERAAGTILWWLRQHPETTVAVQQLAGVAGLDSDAHGARVRAVLRYLVDQGAPIVTSSRGVRYTHDRSALRNAAFSLVRRADSLLARASALATTANRLEKEDS